MGNVTRAHRTLLVLGKYHMDAEHFYFWLVGLCLSSKLLHKECALHPPQEWQSAHRQAKGSHRGQQSVAVLIRLHVSGLKHQAPSSPSMSLHEFCCTGVARVSEIGLCSTNTLLTTFQLHHLLQYDLSSQNDWCAVKPKCDTQPLHWLQHFSDSADMLSISQIPQPALCAGIRRRLPLALSDKSYIHLLKCVMNISDAVVSSSMLQ